MLSFFPRDVLDEIWDLNESVSEGFPTYSSMSMYIKYFETVHVYMTHALTSMQLVLSELAFKVQSANTADLESGQSVSSLCK